MRLFRNGKASLERLDTTARNFPFSLFTLPQILRVPRPVFPTRFCLFYPEIVPAAPNQHRPLLDLRREPGNTGPPPLLVVCSHIHSKTACRGFESFCPCQKPAETLRFCRFSFSMCCMVTVFTLVQTVAFRIRLHLPATALIPSSTWNAPGFALFRLFRVRFCVFRLFGRAKFSTWFLCTLPHSVYRLKSLVIPVRREVSFFT